MFLIGNFEAAIVVVVVVAAVVVVVVMVILLYVLFFCSNLGNNSFPELPNQGLEKVISIKVHNNRYLREFPGPENFPLVRTLTLSYAYHCCPFLRYVVKVDVKETHIMKNLLIFNGHIELLSNN